MTDHIAARAGDAASLTPQTLSAAVHDTFLTSVCALLVGAVLVMLLRVPVVKAPAPSRQQESSSHPARGELALGVHEFEPRKSA